MVHLTALDRVTMYQSVKYQSRTDWYQPVAADGHPSRVHQYPIFIFSLVFFQILGIFLMILSDESRHSFIFRNINLFSSAYPIQGFLKHYCETVPQFVLFFLYLIMLLIFWQSTQLVAKCSSRCYISSLSCPLPAFLWWVIAIKSNYNYYY